MIQEITAALQKFLQRLRDYRLLHQHGNGLMLTDLSEHAWRVKRIERLRMENPLRESY